MVKHIIKLIISSLIFLFISCSSSSEIFLPEVVSPDIYKVLLDNNDVKVLEVTFEPGQSDNMHDHNPVTFYLVEGGKAQVTLPDGTVNEREIPTGFTGHNTDKVRHQVKNIGENTIKIILVEHKKIRSKSSTNNKDYLFPEKVSPDVYKVLLENDDVKVLEVAFEPGQGDNMHDHNPMTVYVLQGGKAQTTLPDGTINEQEVPSGVSFFAKEGQRHQARNIGDNTIKILLVEYK